MTGKDAQEFQYLLKRIEENGLKFVVEEERFVLKDKDFQHIGSFNLSNEILSFLYGYEWGKKSL